MNRYDVDIANEPDAEIVYDIKNVDYLSARETMQLLNALESALAAERARTDTLAQALEKARTAMKFYIATAFSMSTDEAEHSNISAMQEIDAALSDWRTARGKRGDA